MANHPSVKINKQTIYQSRNQAIKSLAKKAGKVAAKNGRGRKPKTDASPFGANGGDTQKQFQQILELTQQIPADKIRKLLDLAEQLQKI